MLKNGALRTIYLTLHCVVVPIKSSVRLLLPFMMEQLLLEQPRLLLHGPRFSSLELQQDVTSGLDRIWPSLWVVRVLKLQRPTLVFKRCVHSVTFRLVNHRGNTIY